MHKPSQLQFLTKSTSKKTKKEDHVRLRALNGLLYKALSELLCTPEVSQEVYDLNVELSKVGRGARPRRNLGTASPAAGKEAPDHPRVFGLGCRSVAECGHLSTKDRQWGACVTKAGEGGDSDRTAPSTGSDTQSV